MLLNLEMMKVSRELTIWAARQPDHVQAIAENIAGNLEIYADRPGLPGLTAALAEQVTTLRTGLGL